MKKALFQEIAEGVLFMVLIVIVVAFIAGFINVIVTVNVIRDNQTTIFENQQEINKQIARTQENQLEIAQLANGSKTLFRINTYNDK